MPNTESNLSNIIKSIENDNDNYLTTINVIKVFGNEMCWDANRKGFRRGAQFWPGRRMTTGPNNQIQKNTEITPDIVVQISSSYGLVAEVKTSLPMENSYWSKYFNQMLKYDDELEGWISPAEEAFLHDLVLIVPDNLRVKLQDYIDSNESINLGMYTRKIALISYNKSSKASEHFTLCRFMGKLSDPEKDESLRTIVSIPAALVLPLYPFVFYDQPPSTSYMMSEIWGRIASYIDLDQMVEDKSKVVIRFSEKQLIEDLKNSNSSYYDDPRIPELPRALWVRKGLKKLVALGYIKPGHENGHYFIEWLKYRHVKSPLDTFNEKIAMAEEAKKEKRGQLALFKK